MTEVRSTEEQCTGIIKEVYEVKWKVRNWILVQHDKQLIQKQFIIIKTGNSSDVKSTWKVGFKMSTEDHNEVIRIYWRLMDLEDGIEDIAVKTSTTFLYGNGSEHSTHVKHNTFERLEEIEVPKFMSYNLGEGSWIPHRERSWSWMDEDGSRNFDLELIMKLPCAKTSSKAVQNELQKIQHMSTKKYQTNFGILLDDLSSADIKIVTSDEKNIFAHRIILKAQCPVFDSMFRCKLTEEKTGIVNVDDICEKTMKIVLHYFYTGQLLPNWKDNDVIVEFIYAAGKYEMTDVLDMIDNGLLEEELGLDVKLGCEMELLSILNKLSLKNAETWLTKKIIKAANGVKSSTELLTLFSKEN